MVDSHLAARAADPQTPATELAKIANEEPELWPTILRNPGCYDGLRDWIGAESQLRARWYTAALTSNSANQSTVQPHSSSIGAVPIRPPADRSGTLAGSPPPDLSPNQEQYSPLPTSARSTAPATESAAALGTGMGVAGSGAATAIRYNAPPGSPQHFGGDAPVGNNPLDASVPPYSANPFDDPPKPRTPIPRRTIIGISIAAAIFIVSALGTGTAWTLLTPRASLPSVSALEPQDPDAPTYLDPDDIENAVDTGVDPGTGSGPDQPGTGGSGSVVGPSEDELRARLLTAPTPSLCGHPPSTLVAGQDPTLAADIGHAGLLLTGSNRDTPLIAIGDLTGDGNNDIAVVMQCDHGGVSWPNEVVFYAPNGTGLAVLGSISLGKMYQSSKGAAQTFQVVDGGVQVDWRAPAPGRDAADDSVHSSAILRFDGTPLLAVHDYTEKIVK